MFLDGAKWIWTSECKVNDYVEFKREIFLEKKPVHSEINISCDKDYALFINETFVSGGQYQMVLPRKSFDTIDITDFLDKGENLIYILVHYQGVWDFSYQEGNGGLIYSLLVDNINYTSDTETLCRRNSYYHTGMTSRISEPMGFNYEYDARLPLNEWEKSTEYGYQYVFVKRPVKKVDYLPISKGEIITQGLYIDSQNSGSVAEKMQNAYLGTREYEFILDTNNYTKENNTYLIYDLKKETTGIFEISFDAPKGTIIDVSYGQHLEDMRVRAFVGGRNFANRIISRGGNQVFTHYFQRCSGRYIELHISEANTKISYVGFIPTNYPIETKNIAFDNYLDQKLYDVSLRTLKLCMHEHYEDTPWREQALYASDSRSQALFGYYCFEKNNFPIKSFQLLSETLQENGFLKLTAPTRYAITIPTFSFIWIIAVYEYLLYGGDTGEVMELLPVIEIMLNSYIANTKNGLNQIVSDDTLWNFYEWQEGLDGIKDGAFETNIKEERYDAPYQLFLAMALNRGAKIFELFHVDAQKYKVAFNEMKIAINKTFYDEENSLYCTYVKNGEKSHYCELTNSLAVYSEICENGEYIRSVLADENNTLIKTSLSNFVFKLDALMMEKDKYLSCTQKSIEKIWSSMLKCGATTFWETSKGGSDFGNAGSLCHGWSALPLYFLCKYKYNMKGENND